MSNFHKLSKNQGFRKYCFTFWEVETETNTKFYFLHPKNLKPRLATSFTQLPID